MSEGFAGQSETIESIYEAALVPAKFQEVLNSISDFVGSTRSLLFTPLATRDEDFYWCARNLGKEDLSSYTDYFAERDIWTQSVVYREAVAGSVLTCEQLVDERKFAKSEWSSDFLRPLDIQYLLTSVLRSGGIDPTGRVHISFYRPPRSEPFGMDERTILQHLIPHLQRAWEIAVRLGSSNALNAAYQTLFDSADYGVLLVDRDAKIEYCNRIGEGMLSQSDGICSKRGALTGRRMSSQRALQVAIGLAAARSGDESRQGSTIRVPRDSGRLPYVLH